MKKLIYILVAVFILGWTNGRCDELGALKVYKALLPIYPKKRLEFMIFCEEMTRQADKIYATDAIIDLVKKNVNINKIQYLSGVKPYKFGTPPAEVAKFWKNKPSSNGFISTSKATILQESKVASGGEKVFFRSPQLDLDGVGFTANFDSRMVNVLNDVNIIIRMKLDKKSGEKGEKNGKDSVVRVKADSMNMDMQKELITLIGNVKVNEANFDIFCSRLMVDLKKDKNKDKNKKKTDSDNTISPTGVSRIICLGDVKIIRKISDAELKKGGEQKAFADKAVYDTVKEQITLSGKKPRIYRGHDMISGEEIILWRNSERMKALRNCLVEMVLPDKNKKTNIAKRTYVNSDSIDFNYSKDIGIFSGNVRVKNADLKLNCNEMTIYLTTREKKETTVKELVDATGKKDLKEIVCVGNVVITRNTGLYGKDEKAVAGHAVYVLKDNKIILSENHPFIISGRDSISGKKMIVWLDQNRLEVTKDSKISIGAKEKVGIAGGKLNKTTVLSNSSDLNYGANELAFSGKVKIDNPQMNLTCNNMKIFLEEDKDAKKSTKSGDSLGGLGGDSKKDLDKIVCTGAVCADNPRALVTCDRMVMTFKDRAAGGAKYGAGIGGVGGGGNREVDQLKCFGHVRMANKPEDPKVKPTVVTSNDAVLNIPGNVGDLIGDVKIEEPRFSLTCKKMKMFAKDITPEQAAANIIENAKHDAIVPKHIGIGKTKEVTRIICFDDVVMTRKLPNEIQRARGDKAVYEVADHNVTLTGTKNKPTLQRGITVMEGEKIILWTDSEKLDIKEGTLKNFDTGGL